MLSSRYFRSFDPWTSRIETGGAVRVSQDGGVTWHERGNAGASPTTVTIDRRNRLYAALPGARIVRSTDGGRTFSQLTRLTRSR